MVVPKEAFGFEFESTAIPLFDNKGTIIGGLGLAIGLEIRKMANNSSSAIIDVEAIIRKY